MNCDRLIFNHQLALSSFSVFLASQAPSVHVCPFLKERLHFILLVDMIDEGVCYLVMSSLSLKHTHRGLPVVLKPCVHSVVDRCTWLD